MKRPDWLPLDPAAPLVLGNRTVGGRVWTASGCFGYGLPDEPPLRDAAGRTPWDGLGLVVTKTLTAAPRAGNPPPRIWDCGHGALNSIGLENVGIDRFLAEYWPRLRRRGVPLLVSIAGTSPDEFGRLTARLAAAAGDAPHWHGVELNLSCPNVAHGGVDFGRDPATVRACVAAARAEAGDRLVLAKLTPNVARMAPLAEAAAAAGADAVTAINTLVGMDIDLRTGRPVLARRRGGYSGPAILPLALARVDEIVRETGVPVIGVGGIRTVADVWKFFAVGAVAVQVGTAQLADPFTAARLARAVGGGPDQ